MTVSGMGGACVLRDVGDIVGLLCGHYLRIGLGHVAFVDDGSTDGTFEFLSALSRRETRISVTRVVKDTFDQPELMTDLSNRLIREGCHVILPFDADEFWNVSARALEERYRNRTDICFSARVLNFVQWRSRERPTSWGLFGIRYRAPALIEADRSSITAFQYPFVCVDMRKAGFKTQTEVRVARGQHYLVDGPTAVDDYPYEIFHLPLRYKSELPKRALNYEPRRARRRSSIRESWQSQFFRDASEAGREDDVWSLNSTDHRLVLNTSQATIRLVPDRRLQVALLKSWAYMMMRHGSLMRRHHRQFFSASRRPDQPEQSPPQP
jgi:hypothetical protein